MASMFLAVSMNVSPFDRLLPEAEKSTVSAPSRRAASEKLVRVRVEASKNRLAQVLPREDRNLLRAAGRRFFERHGRVENRVDLFGREALRDPTNDAASRLAGPRRCRPSRYSCETWRMAATSDPACRHCARSTTRRTPRE